MAHICGINTRRNPSLTEVEVLLIKLDTTGPGFLQRFERVLRHGDERLYTVIAREALDAFFLAVNPSLDCLGFGHDVSGYESVFYLVVADKRIVIDVSGKVLHH